MSTSITMNPARANYLFSGVGRVYISGNGTIGSAIWLVMTLFDATAGIEIPGSRVLAAFVSLTSANQNVQFQYSVPVVSEVYQTAGGHVIQLHLTPVASPGAHVAAYGFYDDDNGKTAIHYGSYTTPAA